METEDHQPQHYGLTTDLTQLQLLIMNSPSSMHSPPPPQLTIEQLTFLDHRNLFSSPLVTTTTTNNNQHHYDDEMMMMTMIGGCDDMMMVPRGPSVSTPPPPFSDGGLGLEKDEGVGGCTGGDESTGRWPRKETLTLLEIRSSLDPKFKQPNQKGLLWEEVSRIMCEEHGYQRSGKKCKEKFENLHKYYKNTKDSAATHHHQDNNNHYYCDNSIINSSLFDFDDTSISSDHNNNNNNNNNNIDDDGKRRKKKKRKSSNESDYNNNNWKVKKMRDLIDSEMRKVVKKQEEWLEKVVKVFEEKEKERVLREEIWRKEEEIRVENEHKFWAMKREWIEARNSVLMDALKKLK